MNNLDKKYTDLVNDAYKNYLNNWKPIGEGPIYINPLSQEEFINKIKTDDEFAKKWGVKVEIRELSLYDRTKILVSRSDNKKDFYDRNGKLIVEEKLVLDEYKIPTKVISFTYNNETIEIYE